MSTKYSIRSDVHEALTMAQTLQDYILSDQLYGFASGNIFSGMPSLTVGALLLRLRRLHILRDAMPDSQSKKLDKAVDLYQYVRTEWAYHYEQKLTREAHSRLDAMKGFFYDCDRSMRLCIGIYKPELMRRTIVQELWREIQALSVRDDDLQDKMYSTDEQLRQYVETADFQWSEQLVPAYPEDEFWWLYHSPPDLA